MREFNNKTLSCYYIQDDVIDNKQFGQGDYKPRPYEVSLSFVSGLDCCWRGPARTKKKGTIQHKKVRPHQIWPAKVTQLCPYFVRLHLLCRHRRTAAANSTETVQQTPFKYRIISIYIFCGRVRKPFRNVICSPRI